MPVEITGKETNQELIEKIDILLGEIDKLMDREIRLGLREKGGELIG